MGFDFHGTQMNADQANCGVQRDRPRDARVRSQGRVATVNPVSVIRAIRVIRVPLIGDRLSS